MRARDAPEIA